MARTRIAALIIHGIGEQNPYEALDAFGRGLAGYFRVQKGQLEHRLAHRDGVAHSMVRMPLSARADAPADDLDLYELYWAPMVQGRISVRQVLAWIIRTSFTPLRAIAQQWEVLSQESDARRRQGWMVVREILRTAGLLALALLIAAPFVIAALERRALTDAGKAVLGVLAHIEHPLALIVWVVLVVFALSILWGLRRALPRRGERLDIEEESERTWRWWWAVAALLLLGLAWLLALRRELGVLAVVAEIVGALWGPPLVTVATATLALILTRPLVKYLGDVTLYVTADENSAFFRTRAEILKASSDRLRMLLTDDGYRAVYVAGHSLGSVIAYDTINRLIREVIAEPAGGKLTLDQLRRLRGLLTFGSPLDKVNYFFRIEVDRNQAIRAQALSLLHGFRKKSSGRSYGNLTFATPKFDDLPEFRWLNVYSRSDFVSGRLDFYRVDRQEHRGYWNPLTAHLAYWNDPKFYGLAALHWLA